MVNPIDPACIAFDFDGVVADTMTRFVAIGQKDFGLSDLRLEKITSYDLESCLQIETDTLIAIMMQLIALDDTLALSPFPGAVSLLSAIAQKTGSLLFVTARPDPDPVAQWLTAVAGLPPAVCKVIATGDFDSKVGVLQEEQKTVFVEDRLETCFLLAEAGIRPVLFVQPWNRRPHPFSEVCSWEDIGKMVAS